MEHAAKQKESDIAPLSHRNADGEVYLRSLAAEQQIRAAVSLDAEGVWRCAEVTDRLNAEYLGEECLVYLIRHFHRAGDKALVNHLAECLLRRIGSLVRKHLHALPPEMADDGYGEVVERLFAQILDLESDQGDFLQVRFWPALEKIAVRAFQRQLTALKRGEIAISLSNRPGHTDEEDGDVYGGMSPSSTLEIASPSVEQAAIDNQLIRDALTFIKEPMRSAFLLRHYYGWPIEDQDPNVRTISRAFQKDPRTIRNWLKSASQALEKWRGEQE